MYYIEKRIEISACHRLDLDYESKCTRVHGHNHRFVNEVVDFNPTAENLARWVVERVPFCYKATVQESEGNIATYEVKS